MQRKKVQISLGIHAVWSAPLLFAALIVLYRKTTLSKLYDYDSIFSCFRIFSSFYTTFSIGQYDERVAVPLVHNLVTPALGKSEFLQQLLFFCFKCSNLSPGGNKLSPFMKIYVLQSLWPVGASFTKQLRKNLGLSSFLSEKFTPCSSLRLKSATSTSKALQSYGTDNEAFEDNLGISFVISP